MRFLYVTGARMAFIPMLTAWPQAPLPHSNHRMNFWHITLHVVKIWCSLLALEKALSASIFLAPLILPSDCFSQWWVDGSMHGITMSLNVSFLFSAAYTGIPILMTRDSSLKPYVFLLQGMSIGMWMPTCTLIPAVWLELVLSARVPPTAGLLGMWRHAGRSTG